MYGFPRGYRTHMFYNKKYTTQHSTAQIPWDIRNNTTFFKEGDVITFYTFLTCGPLKKNNHRENICTKYPSKTYYFTKNTISLWNFISCHREYSQLERWKPFAFSAVVGIHASGISIPLFLLMLLGWILVCSGNHCFKDIISQLQ